MAVILYLNGLSEDLKPEKYTFSESEIISIFHEYKKIQTRRISQVPNTWCVWGESDSLGDDYYNKLGSDILDIDCYSPILFIHDTEIDPIWKLTDDIIQNGYDRFKRDLFKFLDEEAIETLKELEEIRSKNGNSNLLVLNQVGISPDKRVIFELDPDSQNEDFLEPDNFEEFAVKSYNYLSKNFRKRADFIVYEDKKIILIIEKSKVSYFLSVLLDFFQKKEEYLACSSLLKIKEKWEKQRKKKE